MSSENHIQLNQTLSLAIKRSGMTLREISNETGISVSTLSDWQSGRLPSDPVKLRKLAHFLGLSLHEILFGVKDPLDASVSNAWLTENIEAGKFEIILRRVNSYGL